MSVFLELSSNQIRECIRANPNCFGFGLEFTGIKWSSMLESVYKIPGGPVCCTQKSNEVPCSGGHNVTALGTPQLWNM